MRLRIGIGASPDAEELVDHVLGRFDQSEKPTVDNALERATEAIEDLAHNGLASAMNNYNRAE
jgi:PTH1 family peptidyl-tRNA hydrolase